MTRRGLHYHRCNCEPCLISRAERAERTAASWRRQAAFIYERERLEAKDVTRGEFEELERRITALEEKLSG